MKMNMLKAKSHKSILFYLKKMLFHGNAGGFHGKGSIFYADRILLMLV